MKWNKHWELKNKHAFLGASKWHWVNYDDDKLLATYHNFLAIQRGTELHEFAAKAIELGIKVVRKNQTLNLYINDAISYGMIPEQILYYSDNFFGTADAISFKNGKLRIHDLKTGSTPAHMEQLEIYAALFCLEYGVSPNDISIELRIYQSNEVAVYEPDPNDILDIMDKAVVFDRLINEQRMESLNV
jgi:hypothetical protein